MSAYPTGTFPATFIGGTAGAWRIDRSAAIAGDPLPPAERLEVRDGIVTTSGGVWRLAGVAGHARYAERAEKARLDAVSPPLSRPEATLAALIPIRKSAAWWALPQDERRAILEERSHHIADSMPFVPRIARRLYHARDLGQPFDFLTWFEFAPEHARAFDELVAMLVEREVDIRLSR
jgi:hypothetical protein